jgi:hypothetical protein
MLRVFGGCVAAGQLPAEWEIAADGAPSNEVPPVLGETNAGVAALTWWKTSLTHRLLHDVMTLPEAAAIACPDQAKPAVVDPLLLGTVVSAFAESFGQRFLARYLLQVCEDARIDATLAERFPGMRSSLREMQAWELQQRPDLRTLTPRATVVELVTRASISADGSLLCHDAPAPSRRAVRDAFDTVLRPGAALTDSMHLAAALYAVVSRLGVEGDLPADLPRQVAVALDTAVVDLTVKAADVSGMEGAEALSVRAHNATYRDRLVLRAQDYRQDNSGNRPVVFEYGGNAAAHEAAHAGAHGGSGGTTEAGSEHEHGHHDQIAPEEMAARYESPWQPQPHEHRIAEDDWWRDDPEVGPLPRSYDLGHSVYPEWDEAGRQMRRRWCALREEPVPVRRTPRLYDKLAWAMAPRMAHLVDAVARAPRERLTRRSQLTDGTDIDVDALLRYLSDVRAAGSGSENIYTAMHRDERDIALALVLDTSASTADHVRGEGGDVDAVTQKLHGAWGREYRRTLDIEIEAATLLMEAARGMNDAFGVFGFSSDGRARNEFSVVKDFLEPIDDGVKARLCSLRPHGTTRLGVAIRHASLRLLRCGANTPILLMLSDGLPRDRGYGDGVDDSMPAAAYADVAAAVDESRRHGIRTVLLLTAEPGVEALVGQCPPGVVRPLASAEDLPRALLAAYAENGAL